MTAMGTAATEEVAAADRSIIQPVAGPAAGSPEVSGAMEIA